MNWREVILWVTALATGAVNAATPAWEKAGVRVVSNVVTTAEVNVGPERLPSTPREFYNAGTRKLKSGKLKEAEAMLENAVSSQDDRVQPGALYNLGNARFALGVEELKKGPAAAPTREQSTAASELGRDAIQSATDALASNDVDRMVQSYMQGRGARRELRSAIKAVKRAMQVFGKALNKWQRASGDFKGAAELNPQDADARHNAEVVDRSIAMLIDSLKELEQAAQALGQQKQDLGEKMKELRGRIPEPNMPPGAAGDDEEEEDMPQGPMEGQEEGPTKDGEEQTPVSEEQAGWMLEGYKLDQGRRLPMGQGEAAEPSNRNRPTW